MLDDVERVKLGFELVRDLSSELITLATGVIALSVTFARELFQGIPERGRLAVKVAWVLCLVSVIFGVLQMMAITGALVPPDGRFGVLDTVPENARLFGGIQIVTFMLGLLAIIVFAWRGLGRLGTEAVEAAARPQVPFIPIAPHSAGRKRRRARR
ncbi:MAG TPA: hypothetical protein VEQ60_11645 [Longimicrobium sp.]|nr:hypothetical protein [Longimicrobium sp.]